MFHRFRVILFIIVLVLIGGAIAWYLRMQTPQTTGSQTVVRQKLSDEQYQRHVTDVLSQVAAAPSDSLPAAVVAAVSQLQSLVVNDQVKYDHLTLFMAFDLWSKQNSAQNAQVKEKLLLFAKHQPWSASAIQSVVTKLPTS